MDVQFCDGLQSLDENGNCVNNKLDIADDDKIIENTKIIYDGFGGITLVDDSFLLNYEQLKICFSVFCIDYCATSGCKCCVYWEWILNNEWDKVRNFMNHPHFYNLTQEEREYVKLMSDFETPLNNSVVFRFYSTHSAAHLGYFKLQPQNGLRWALYRPTRAKELVLKYMLRQKRCVMELSKINYWDQFTIKEIRTMCNALGLFVLKSERTEKEILAGYIKKALSQKYLAMEYLVLR
eukprot:Pgem_evm1s1666